RRGAFAADSNEGDLRITVEPYSGYGIDSIDVEPQGRTAQITFGHCRQWLDDIAETGEPQHQFLLPSALRRDLYSGAHPFLNHLPGARHAVKARTLEVGFLH